MNPPPEELILTLITNSDQSQKEPDIIHNSPIQIPNTPPALKLTKVRSEPLRTQKTKTVHIMLLYS